MDRADDSAEQCRNLVAGLADAGVASAFISPGSRNTPLTLAFAWSAEINDISIRDERSAGFVALGAAKATDLPSVVVCTSGSATTHYLPAIVEADQSSTPMIVITADRPVELRGTFAPQTMDQTHLYGSHVKASIELGTPGTNWRETARAIVETARDGIAGVVHVNVPLSDPLVPDSRPATPDHVSGPRAVSLPDDGADMPSLDEEFEGRRVLIVAGGSCGAEFPALLGGYAGALAAPVIADPQCAPAHPNTLRCADMLARTGHLDTLRPDVVLRLGGLPTSKTITSWLEACGVPQILVGRSRLSDPLGSTTRHLDVPKADFISRVPGYTADPDYLHAWKQSDDVVTTSMHRSLASNTLTEPAVARALTERTPGGATLFVGSSMPIRDVDTYGVVRPDVRVVANRGVNGIDGSISTALGVATSGTPTTALVGDVAALHDATALSEAARLDSPLRVVVVNNDGGGIFSFLPQRRSDVISDDIYERHWGTPHGLSLSAIAQAMGLEATRVDSMSDLSEAVAAPIKAELIEVMTDRTENVDVHRAISSAVRGALPSR